MSDDDNITLLKKITTATLRKGTDFIDITVKHTPAEEAIRIANAIAEAGAERKAQSEKNRTKRAFEALDEELTTQQEKITALQSLINQNGPPSSHENETLEKETAFLSEMKTKQQETRDFLKTPRIPITIHQRAQ